LEIAQYVRGFARRLGVVAVIVAIAAVGSTLFFVLGPRLYRASAIVVIPVPGLSPSLIASVTQAVADFQAAVGTRVVAERVAAYAGVDADRIEAGIESRRVAGSAVVELIFEDESREKAEIVVIGAGREASALLLEARVAPAREQLDMAAGANEDARTAIRDFLAETGYLRPEQVFRDETARLIHLGDEAKGLWAAGRVDAAEKLERRIASRQTVLADQLVAYQRLTEDEARSVSALSVAEQSFASAEANLRAARAIDPEGAGADVIPVPRTEAFVRTVVSSVVIATVLAILLVALLEFLPRRRGPSPETSANDRAEPIHAR